MPRAAEIIAKALEREGVECVFTLPDGWMMPIYEELEKVDIRIVSMRTEQAAAAAADGWSRFTRRLGVVMVAVGPGTANVMPSLAQAYYAGSPVLALGGRAPIANVDRMAFEEVDTHRWVEKYTKHSRLVPSACRLLDYVQDAIRQSMTGRLGPALLEIPKDVAGGECGEELVYEAPERYRPQGRIHGDPSLVAKAAEIMTKSERPLIIAGSGAYWSDASEELVRLAERIHAPVATEGLAVGCIPSAHPLFASHASAGLISRAADLIIALGARFDEFLGFGTDQSFYDKDVKVIHVDIDPTVIGKNRPADVGIWGDAKAVIGQMLQALPKEPSENGEAGWSTNVGAIIRAYYEEMETEAMSDEVPIRPQRLMRDLREFAGRDATFVLDGGDTTAWAYLYLRPSKPGQVIWSHGPFGMIGTGVPMGIAARLARPREAVYVVTGDGSFLMDGVEIETASRHRVPIVVVVMDDSTWGDVYHNRILASGSKESGRYALLQQRAYDKFAQSLGGYGEVVEEPGEIANALRRAVDSGLPSVLDVRVSNEYVSPLSQVQGFLKKQ